MNPSNMPIYYAAQVGAATTGVNVAAANASYSYAVDHVNVVVGALTGGYVRIGGGTGGATNTIFYTTKTGTYDIQMDGDGFRLPSNSNLSYAVSGTGPEVNIVVGYHPIKTA